MRSKPRLILSHLGCKFKRIFPMVTDMSGLNKKFLLVVFCLGFQSVQAADNDISASIAPKPQKASQSAPVFSVTPVAPPPKSFPPTSDLTRDNPYFFDSYSQAVSKKIRSVWSPNIQAHEATISFKIHRNGSISDIQIVRSSGSEKSNNALIQTIEKAAPFEPLPRGAKETEPYQFSYCGFPFSDPHLKASSLSEEIDWGPYMADVQRRIKRNLHPPEGYDFNKTPFIIFKIHRDGSISPAHLSRSSGNKEVDQSFIDAITAAAPFDPLPKRSKEEVEIPYHPQWCPSGRGTSQSDSFKRF